jgi:hypothetical protein
MFIPFHDVVTEVDVRVILLFLASFNDISDTVFKRELGYLSILTRLGAERLRNWCYAPRRVAVCLFERALKPAPGLT